MRIYYTNRSLKLRCLDTSPARLKQILVRATSSNSGSNSTTTITNPGSCGFGQYEAVFMQLADEHKTINAFELQELLEACLPNDYIKSCANMEVCRQVVMTMDVSLLLPLLLNQFQFYIFINVWNRYVKSMNTLII